MRHRDTLSLVTAAVALVGLIGGGIWAMEERYAKATELGRHERTHGDEAKTFQREVLETRRDFLEGQLFQLRQRPALSGPERERLNELERTLEHVNSRLKALMFRWPGDGAGQAAIAHHGGGHDGRRDG